MKVACSAVLHSTSALHTISKGRSYSFVNYTIYSLSTINSRKLRGRKYRELDDISSDSRARQGEAGFTPHTRFELPQSGPFRSSL